MTQEKALQALHSENERLGLYKDAYAQRIEQNFCPRCGKRLGGEDSIHTCTPPQEQQSCDKRTWVGLPDEEIDSYFEDHGWSPSEYYYPVIKDIEAKLKELNT
jgi:hypothetical protein